MTAYDRQLDDTERDRLGLPAAGCCCPDHPHDWYERADGGRTWVECNACGEAMTARLIDLADLEDRVAHAFAGLDLLPGSVLRLTEAAARRLARLAVEEFLRPPDGGRQ